MLNKEHTKRKENKDERDSFMEFIPAYSHSVLVGRWEQNRYQSEVHANNAIVPCIWVDGGCEKHKTLNQDDYTLAPFQGKSTKRAFEAMKRDVHSNKMECKGSLSYMSHGKKYRQNFTSTNTLTYELWPKMCLDICLKEAAKVAPAEPCPLVLHKQMRLDPLDSYGNHPINNKRRYVKCKELAERCFGRPTSYGRDFRIPDTRKNVNSENALGQWIDSAEAARVQDKSIILNCNIHDDLENPATK